MGRVTRGKIQWVWRSIGHWASMFFRMALGTIGLMGLAISGNWLEAAQADPEVRIVAPESAAHLSKDVTIVVEVSKATAPIQLTLLKNGTFLDTIQISAEDRNDMPLRVTMEWQTQKELDGPHSLQARVWDAQGRQAVSIPVQVFVDNTPPQIHLKRPTAHQAWIGNEVMEADASDIGGIAEVRFIIDGIVRGSVKAPPYRWSIDTNNLHNGIHSVEARAVDLAGNHVTSPSVLVRISNPNHPPVLQPIGRQRVAEGQTLSFTVHAMDPDGARDPVTYRAYNLPPWASFDPDTGKFTATPDFTAVGSNEREKEYIVRFQACDPEPLCAGLDVSIVVENVNQPPQLPAISNLTVREGESVVIPMEALDPDEDELTYSTGPLPVWLKFNRFTRTLSGTPDFGVASLKEPEVSYPITVKVCDPQGQCDEKRFQIVVKNVNRPPVIKAIADKTIEEGKTLSFRLEASDPDGDPLIWSVSGLPEGATFRDAGDGIGTFAWTTRTDQAGRYVVSFAVSDTDLEDRQQVILNIAEVSLSISGVVQDRSGQPLPGVTIKCTGPGQLTRFATTDERGFYIFQDMPASAWTIKPDYQPQTTFSSKAKKGLGYHFSPLSRRVVLDRSDATKMDFTAFPD
jgi:hypothetical protein